MFLSTAAAHIAIRCDHDIHHPSVFQYEEIERHRCLSLLGLMRAPAGPSVLESAGPIGVLKFLFVPP